MGFLAGSLGLLDSARFRACSGGWGFGVQGSDVDVDVDVDVDR